MIRFARKELHVLHREHKCCVRLEFYFKRLLVVVTWPECVFLGGGQGTRNLGGGVAKYCLKTFTTVATTWSGFASQGVLTTTPLMFAALSCTMQVM